MPQLLRGVVVRLETMGHMDRVPVKLRYAEGAGFQHDALRSLHFEAPTHRPLSSSFFVVHI